MPPINLIKARLAEKMGIISIQVVILCMAVLICHAIGAAPITGDLLLVEGSKATISVLMDEFPELEPARETFLAANDTFWLNRINKQLLLVQYRLVFRPSFHPGDPTKMQLVLPAFDQFDVKFEGPAKWKTIQGHHHVAREYTFKTHIVGLAGSAAKCDPNLAHMHGHVTEKFHLPADPQLLVQRTGLACMDEALFPLNSVDEETPDVYYDDSCDFEPIAPIGVCEQCHCTAQVNVSCVDALKQYIGETQVNLKFTRVPWNEQTAAHYEALNKYDLQPTATGANLVGKIDAMKHNFIVYKYYVNGSCERKECLDGDGWRRLVLFDATHINIGSKDMDIFTLTFDDGNQTSFNESLYHYLYYWDNCHHHPHFSAYATFGIGASKGRKQGFCIQTTGRDINHRLVSMVSKYWNCNTQGVAPGWSDMYNVGIPCQWVDITTLPSTDTIHTSLEMIGNPKGWLCEGVKDGNKFVRTGEFTTSPPYDAARKSIDKWKCDESPGAYDDNHDSLPLAIPPAGHGAVTSPCYESGQVFGPKRDCEFSLVAPFESCMPGVETHLHCSMSSPDDDAQVVRICESSIMLETGTACRYRASLANNAMINATLNLSFICPAARDLQKEVGGRFSIYTGALLNGITETVPVSCVLA